MTRGMSPEAESVYRRLLVHSDWGVEMLALDLGLSEQSIRDALDELAELALLHRSDHEPGMLRAIGPEAALAIARARSEAEEARRRQTIESLTATLAVLAELHPRDRPRDEIVRLDGVDAVRTRLVELSATVKSEVLSLNPRSTQTPDAKASSRILNERMLERGVAIRAINPNSFRNDPGLVEYAAWLTDLGGQVRTAPTIPTLMIIYDRETLVAPIDPKNTRLGAVEVRSPGIVAIAHELFELIWSPAVPLGVTPRDEEGLDAQERALLALLASGATDTAAAHRLGIHLRTVTRMMTGLFERVGAKSRFELGVIAAERGWTASRRPSM